MFTTEFARNEYKRAQEVTALAVKSYCDGTVVHGVQVLWGRTFGQMADYQLSMLACGAWVIYSQKKTYSFDECQKAKTIFDVFSGLILDRGWTPYDRFHAMLDYTAKTMKPYALRD